MLNVDVKCLLSNVRCQMLNVDVKTWSWPCSSGPGDWFGASSTPFGKQLSEAACTVRLVLQVSELDDNFNFTHNIHF